MKSAMFIMHADVLHLRCVFKRGTPVPQLLPYHSPNAERARRTRTGTIMEMGRAHDPTRPCRDEICRAGKSLTPIYPYIPSLYYTLCSLIYIYIYFFFHAIAQSNHVSMFGSI